MLEPIEQTFTIEGKEYKFSKFKSSLAFEFFRWSKSVLPNPYEAIAKIASQFCTEAQVAMVKSAEKKNDLRGSVRDQEAQELLGTEIGLRKVFALLLRKYQPNLKEADTNRLYDSFEEQGESVLDLVEKASGKNEVKESDIEKDFFRGDRITPANQTKNPA